MQYTQENNNVVTTDVWLKYHASALLAYAQNDSQFAESLAHHIQKKQWGNTNDREFSPPSVFITPIKQSEAVDEAIWILEQLSITPSASKSRSLLSSWAKNYESPKDFVFGVVGLAIIGPTLGLISNKKKKYSVLKTVIEKHWYCKQPPHIIAKYVQRINIQVITQELRYAGGNAYKLHPDSVAWCLEEPVTRIYLIDQVELDILNIACISEHLSHHADVVNGAVRAISISPCVNDEFIQQFSTEEPK